MRALEPRRHLTIGELARESGVGVETIRFYERRGLLERPARPVRGFRAYTSAAAERIGFVREAQALGFTLKEVRDLLDLRSAPGTDSAAVRGRAAAKLGQLDTRMARLSGMRSALHGLLARCPGRGSLEDCPIIAALSAPPQRAAKQQPRGKRRTAMKTGELTIDGMHCDGCAKTVESLLSAEPGVKMASASFTTGSAKVVFDPEKIELTALARAVERAGYVVRSSR